MIFWNIVIAIASFVLNLVLAPKPQNAKPSALGDFNIPTASEGIEIPVVFGTVHIKNPNCVWYGDFDSDAIKGPHRYGFFGPRVTVGYQYQIGMHMILCHGVHDAVRNIWAGDKLLWDVTNGAEGPIVGSRSIILDKKNFFGGKDKEGGIWGQVNFWDGDPAQGQDPYLADRLGTHDITPAFRGVVSCVWRNTDMATGGLHIGTTTYLKPWIFQLQRIHKTSEGVTQWYDARAAVPDTPPGGSAALTARAVADSADIRATNGHKWFDIYDSSIVHLSADTHRLIIEDVLTGAVRASIDITAWGPPIWFFISGSTSEVLALDGAGIIHVYDLNSGATKSTFGGVPDPTPSGDSLGQLVATPNTILIGSTTYMFYGSTFGIVCCMNVSGGWTYQWVMSMGGPGTQSPIIAVSPTTLVFRSAAGTVRQVPWTSLGTGTITVVDLFTLLGWSVGTSDPVNSVAYVAASGNWFLTAAGGKSATLNPTLTAVVASYDDPTMDTGTSDALYLRSRRMISGTTAAYYQVGTNHPSATESAVFFYDTITDRPIERHLLSEWGFNLGIGREGGYSPQQRAFLIADIFGNNGLHVLMLPGDGRDMNPAHIIRECLTDKIWGMGYNDIDIDDDSFTYAADTFYNEAFGLSLQWNREEKLEEFISVILSHVDAYLYLRRDTGKFYLKPIRNDYDISTLPIFDEDDVVSWDEITRREPAESINSVTVTYTDRQNMGNDASHQVDNIAQIQQLGERISTTRVYPGISRGSLAAQVATRDQRSLGIGLISGHVTGKRTFDILYPGDPFRLISARHNLDGEVMRVASMKFGDGRDNKIILQLLEDVFRLGAPDLVDTSEGDWENPAEPPSAVFPRLVWEAPYWELYDMAGGVNAAAMLSADPNAGLLVTAGGKPTRTSINALVYVDGVEEETMDFAPAGTLGSAIAAFDTSITLNGAVGTGSITAGMLAVIIGATLDTTEIVMITAVSGVSLTVSRGLVDTVPQSHPAGQSVVVFDGFSITDFNTRTAGDAPSVRLLTQTTNSSLDYALAPADVVTFGSRAIRPLRPANVKVEGFASGPVDGDGLANFHVTWANRNRLTETGAALAWTAADVTPETGQTTRIDLLDAAGTTILATYTGLTGTSYSVPSTGFGSHTTGIIRVSSERDGFRSLQAYQISVLVTSGYGYGYGYNYGGI